MESSIVEYIWRHPTCQPSILPVLPWAWSWSISRGLTFHPDGFKTYNVPALLTTVCGLNIMNAMQVQWWWFALPIVKFQYQWVFLDFLVDNYLIYLDISTVFFETINGKNGDLVWALHPRSSAVELRGITTGYVHEHLAKSEAQPLLSPNLTTRAMAIHGLGHGKV